MQLVGIQIYNLDIARIKNQRNDIHLELVSELFTEAYIASLRRFLATRRLCTNNYSDNGTNFVAAEKELKKVIFEK